MEYLKLQVLTVIVIISIKNIFGNKFKHSGKPQLQAKTNNLDGLII